MSQDKTVRSDNLQDQFLAEPITGDKAVQLAANTPGPDPVFRLNPPQGRRQLGDLHGEATAGHQLGLSEDHEGKRTLVFGMQLVCVYQRGYDPLADELSNGWDGDCIHRILLPEKGLTLGTFYYPAVVNMKRDWETNNVEDWDVELIEYQGVIPAEGNELESA